MGSESELAEEGVEETTPFIVVRLGELKKNRNMILNVDGLKNGGGRGAGSGAVDGDGGGVGGVRGGVRLVGIEEWIVIHGGHGDEIAGDEQRRLSRGRST
jgi:hypothetical protein